MEKQRFYEIDDFVLCRHFGVPFGPHGGLTVPSFGHVGALWGHLGTILGPWSHLGASWGRLGASWSLLVAILEPVVAIMRPLGALGHLVPTGSPYGYHFASWVDFGPMLRQFGNGGTTL